MKSNENFFLPRRINSMGLQILQKETTFKTLLGSNYFFLEQAPVVKAGNNISDWVASFASVSFPQSPFTHFKN